MAGDGGDLSDRAVGLREPRHRSPSQIVKRQAHNVRLARRVTPCFAESIRLPGVPALVSENNRRRAPSVVEHSAQALGDGYIDPPAGLRLAKPNPKAPLLVRLVCGP